MMETIGPALAKVMDQDNDGAVTKAEFIGAFKKWLTDWDTDKVGALDAGKIATGLSAAVPRLDFGGFGGGPPRGGGNNPGGGRAPGGFGRGGFGRGMLAEMMVAQGDKNSDAKLSKAELTSLADGWFTKLDEGKKGKASESQFTDKFGEALGLGREAGSTATIATGLFAAADRDKDHWVTSSELKATFEGWFAEWDAEKSGALDQESLSAGLRNALPQQDFGGFVGLARRGPQGGEGRGGRGNSGPPAKPLTAEQVGLVRAWIDQGAQ